MNIKLDENLPVSLAGDPSAIGHDVDTVQMEGLAGTDDITVWESAQREQRFFITQDLDFSDIRRFLQATHEGLLLVRLTKPSRSALAARIRGIFTAENVETWAKCFVVATDSKVRVRR